jgi:hypothetical protein
MRWHVGAVMAVRTAPSDRWRHRRRHFFYHEETIFSTAQAGCWELVHSRVRVVHWRGFGEEKFGEEGLPAV